MNSRKRSVILVSILILGPVAFAQESSTDTPSEVRVWTSQAGSTFTGSVVTIEDSQVVLAGTNGREVTLRRDQLSADDQTHLQNIERQRHDARIAFYRTADFDSSHLPEETMITGIEHVAQLQNFCVPASAEMLLSFYGYDYDQEFLARLTSDDSYSGGGTNVSHLSQGLRNLGIDSVVLQRESPEPERSPLDNLMNGIRSSLAEGRPVIIHYRTVQAGHAVLAVGYNDRRRCFTVMDPNIGKRPERLDYRAIEDVLGGALVVLAPIRETARNQSEPTLPPNAFLSRVSGLTRSANPAALNEFAQRLREEEAIAAEFRNANRIDLRSSQGQTRSFARSQGVEFIQMALKRGLVLVAPQMYDEGPGTILIYGASDQEFQAVEYRPNGSIEKRGVDLLDFSLRWLWRSDREYSLPLVEIAVPIHDA